MDANLDSLQTQFLELLLDGDEDGALEFSRRALAEGATPLEFFSNCITPALTEIGNRFETLDIFLPEMVIAAEIVEKINDHVINPALEQAEGGAAREPAGKVLLATVQGDLHNIGKNMVALMLRVNGFEVIDAGIDVPPAKIVSMAEEGRVDIIGMSTLLTTCLPYVKDTLDHLKGKGLREKYAVIIGGAAPNDDFAAQVGADACGHSAADAVRICTDLMKKRQLAG